MAKNCSIVIFSFKNITEQIAMEIIFNVDIKPTFVAVVRSNAKNCRTLNSTTPVNPMKAKGSIAFLGGKIFFSFHHTIGTRQKTAMNHLKVVKVIGEACSTSVLLTTKLPAHNKQVKSNKP